MPNSNYMRGRRFEYERKSVWEGLGYTVLRTAGSHGFADLVAVRDGRVTFIQCKSTRSHSTANKLIADFRARPPILESKHYHQCLEVKVVGNSRVEQYFV